MSDPAKQPLLADIRREWGALHAELREMITARWDLARLEIQADLLAAKRLMFAGLIAVVLALTALPLLAVCAADALGGWLEMSRGRWLLVFAAALLLIVIAFQLSPLPRRSFFALLALGASCYLLISPGLRLLRSRDRSAAMQLFNRASYYPAALLAVVLTSLLT